MQKEKESHDKQKQTVDSQHHKPDKPSIHALERMKSKHAKCSEHDFAAKVYETMNIYFSAYDGTKQPCYFNFSCVLEDISIAEETFTLLQYVQIWWKVDSPEEIVLRELQPLYTPINWDMIFYNGVEHTNISDPVHRLIKDEDGVECVIHGIYHCRCVLDMMCDLRDFPFDRQAIKARISLDTENYEVLYERPPWVPKKSHGVELVKALNHQLFQVRMAKSLESDYEMQNPVVDFYSNKQGVIMLNILIERLDGQYWTSVFIPFFLIITSSFCGVSVAIEDGGDRLMINVGMLIVVIMFQFNIHAMLPETDYATKMDSYCTIAVLVSTFLCLENSIASLIMQSFPKSHPDHHHVHLWVRRADFTLQFLLFLVWLGMHAWIYSHRDGMRPDWEDVLRRSTGEEYWLPRDAHATKFGCCDQESGEDGLPMAYHFWLGDDRRPGFIKHNFNPAVVKNWDTAQERNEKLKVL